MAEFELNPEILQTAAGSITGDITQIQTAVYGREVRASIAEALYLLYQNIETQMISLTQEEYDALENPDETTLYVIV